MSAIAVARPLPCIAAARDVLALLKLRIAAMIAATALASAVTAGERDVRRLAVLAAAALASAGGAGALNHWLDRDLDARMPRTRSRPLPGGRLAPHAALGLGLTLVLLSGGSWLELGPGAAAYLLAGAVTYAGVYTWWLKPRTPFSIVWGGAAGSFAALAGWQCGGSTLAPAPLLLAGVLFLWTPSHFWSFAIAHESDYRAGGIPTLAAVAGPVRTARAAAASAAGLVAWSFLLGAFLPPAYLLVVVPGGIWFLALAVALARDPRPERAAYVFRLTGVHLLVILAGLVAAGLS